MIVMISIGSVLGFELLDGWSCKEDIMMYDVSRSWLALVEVGGEKLGG